MLKPRRVLICSTTALLFAACGDEVTEVDEVYEKSYMPVLELGEMLLKQACDSSNVGEMLFVKDSSATFICDGYGWTSLTGDFGKTGAKGDDGDDGLDGKNGVDGKDGAKGKQGEQGEQGEQGKTGVAGTSCEASDLEVSDAHANGGVKITCGDKSYELWNGENGAVGEIGAKGATGAQGKSCSLVDKGDGSVEITCGEKTAIFFKAMCGEIPYDPAKQVCFESKLLLSELCGNKSYNPAKQFCDTRDNHVYKYVTIVDGKKVQVWMAENLNYDSKILQEGAADSVEFSWCYEDKTENCEHYGRLYTWAGAMDSVAAFSELGKGCGYGVKCEPDGNVRGICPEGWHLPNDDEWNALLTAVDGNGDAGKKLKSLHGWNSDEASYGNGLDSYGFGILPAGVRYDTGDFYDVGDYAYFWSSSENDGSYANHWFLRNYQEIVNYNYRDKNYGFSIRCIRD